MDQHNCCRRLSYVQRWRTEQSRKGFAGYCRYLRSTHMHLARRSTSIESHISNSSSSSMIRTILEVSSLTAGKYFGLFSSMSMSIAHNPTQYIQMKSLHILTPESFPYYSTIAIIRTSVVSLSMCGSPFEGKSCDMQLHARTVINIALHKFVK